MDSLSDPDSAQTDNPLKTGAKARSRKRTGRGITTKDPAFAQALLDEKIYPSLYEDLDDSDDRAPKNLGKIGEKLRKRRPSLSPQQFTNADFRDFLTTNSGATSESAVMTDVFPIIQGKKKGKPTIPTGQDLPFNHLKEIGNIGCPKPDYFNGVQPAEIHQELREKLGWYIIPCNDTSRPALPNFFLEKKGPSGKGLTVDLQIRQDLVYGARGIHRMQSYNKPELFYNNKVYTFGATYDSPYAMLILYAMHPTEPKDSRNKVEYHTTELSCSSLRSNLETCREGLQALRNLQDLATRCRNRIVRHANRAARPQEHTATAPSSPDHSSQNRTSTATDWSSTIDSETSGDEDLLENRSPPERSFSGLPKEAPVSSAEEYPAANPPPPDQPQQNRNSFTMDESVRTDSEIPRDGTALSDPRREKRSFQSRSPSRERKKARNL
ncbi:MAG: hypothetical protein Q9160_008175 [Pyrenula sp. 1 TL-2023]